MRRPVIVVVLGLATVACSATHVAAQAEYRGIDPTAPSATEACTRLGLSPDHTASASPGSDSRSTVTRGSSSVTGARTPGGRDLTVVAPTPPGVTAPTDQAYQDCLRRR